MHNIVEQPQEQPAPLGATEVLPLHPRSVQLMDSEKVAALRARVHFRDPEDRSKYAGWHWAVHQGFTYIDRLSEADADTILRHLGLTPHDEEYSDGYEEMVHLRYPWKWLEKYQTTHGDMNKLNVRSKT